jgi:hypothetical protein
MRMVDAEVVEGKNEPKEKHSKAKGEHKCPRG